MPSPFKDLGSWAFRKGRSPPFKAKAALMRAGAQAKAKKGPFLSLSLWLVKSRGVINKSKSELYNLGGK